MLAYLSRYTHRVAISNSRLIGFDGTGVTFCYKDYRRSGAERQQVMTLAAGEFICRFLLHVLPRGFHRTATTASSPAPPASSSPASCWPSHRRSTIANRRSRSTSARRVPAAAAA